MPRFPGGLDMQRLMKEAQKIQAEIKRVEEELRPTLRLKALQAEVW